MDIIYYVIVEYYYTATNYFYKIFAYNFFDNF